MVGAVYLDQAFDTVNHEVLITKLSKLNFSPHVIKWIKSYVTDRKQCVHVGHKTLEMVDNYFVVPQGSTLVPLLFSLQINDLSEVCSPTVTFQMNADDTAI